MNTRTLAAAIFVLIAAVPSLSLSGCSAASTIEYPALTGPNFDSFQPGVTTLREAIVEMGASVSQSDMGDGTTLYQWMFDIFRYNSKRAVHIAILFDKKGTMVAVSHKSEIPY